MLARFPVHNLQLSKHTVVIAVVLPDKLVYMISKGKVHLATNIKYHRIVFFGKTMTKCFLFQDKIYNPKIFHFHFKLHVCELLVCMSSNYHLFLLSRRTRFILVKVRVPLVNKIRFTFCSTRVAKKERKVYSISSLVAILCSSKLCSYTQIQFYSTGNLARQQKLKLLYRCSKCFSLSTVMLRDVAEVVESLEFSRNNLFINIFAFIKHLKKSFEPSS